VLAFAHSGHAQTEVERSLEVGEFVRVVDVPAGCADLTVETAPPVEISLALYRRSGERVVEPRVGVGRSVLRICESRDETLALYVTVSRAALVDVSVERASSDSPAAEDGSRTARVRSTGDAHRPSASARLNAAVTRLESDGLARLGPIDALELTRPIDVPLPRVPSGCRWFVVASDGGAVDVAGAEIDEDHVAELVACGPESATLAVHATRGSPRIAFAFLASPTVPLEPSSPLRARVLASLDGRGFSLVREVDVVADRRHEARLPIRVEPNRCVAVASVAHERSSIGLTIGGVVVASSSSRAPAPVLYRCVGAEPAMFEVVVELASTDARARILVAEAPGAETAP